MRQIEILLYPLLVDLIASAITRQRVHIPRLLFKAFKVGIAIFDEEILIVDVVARKKQAHGSRKTQSAITAVGRKSFIARIGMHTCGEVVRIAQRVQAKHLVAPHVQGLPPNEYPPKKRADSPKAKSIYQGVRPFLSYR